MNRTGDLGHFLLSEYDQLNFLLDLDPHSNSSRNQGGNSTLVNSFYFYENEQLTMLWILFVSIVVGNGSVLIGLLLNKSRASRFNYFIKHLAIADLSVGFVSVLTDIIWKLTIEWNAGNVACKVAVVTYSSTYLLVALTIDRYEAITHPMNFFKSWRRARLLVSSAWVLSLVFSFPIVVLYEEKRIQEHVQCWIEFIEPWHWQMYMVTISLTVFFIPAFIIAACYSTIIYTIWSHSNIPERSLQRQNMSDLSQHLKEDLNCKRVSSRGLIPKAKVKTVKMTLIIVFVFIFCWSPYIIFDLLQVFGYIKKTQTNIAVATFIQSLAPLNSAANPIIYCLFSTYICRHLRIPPLFRCCGRKLGKSVKIADTSTSTVLSHAASARYIHLQRLSSAPGRAIRESECLLNGEGNVPGKLGFDAEAETGTGIKVQLCCSDLWERFHRIGTEMIVTKAGRRMFPTLRVRLKALTLSATYIVYLDFDPVDEAIHRYNYQRSKWTVIGPSNSCPTRSIYVHPKSPASGEFWASQEHISFDKVKLTNNRRPSMRDQVPLHSMHRYRPRIHILKVHGHLDHRNVSEYVRANSGKSEIVAFEQTTFVTVTAYQNRQVTALKIESNPFARGFRESVNGRKENRDQRRHPSNRLRLKTLDR